ncbi:hypothetical protein SNEBB_003018 [Seison nebaliae]|nr:hypothetical protein SNEBB_003018 [Seison nebaliae]
MELFKNKLDFSRILCYGNEGADNHSTEHQQFQYIDSKPDKYGYRYWKLIDYKYNKLRGWSVKQEDDMTRLCKLSQTCRKKWEFKDHGLTVINHFLYMILLTALTTVFEKYKLTHFLHQGSLIGSVRHHDVIPWDDDIDIAVTAEYPTKLFVALDELCRNGLITFRCGRSTPIKHSFLNKLIMDSPLLFRNWGEHENLLNRKKTNLTKLLLLEEEFYKLPENNKEPIDILKRSIKDQLYLNSSSRLIQNIKIYFNDISSFKPFHRLLKVWNKNEKYSLTFPAIDLWIIYPSHLPNETKYFANLHPLCPTSKRSGGIIFKRNIILPLYRRPFGPLWIPVPQDIPIYLLICSIRQKILRVMQECISSRWNHKTQSSKNSVDFTCDKLSTFFPFVQTRDSVARHSTSILCYDKLSIAQSFLDLKWLESSFINEKDKKEKKIIQTFLKSRRHLKLFNLPKYLNPVNACIEHLVKDTTLLQTLTIRRT